MEIPEDILNVAKKLAGELLRPGKFQDMYVSGQGIT